jgi:hypothetical protein
MRGNRGLHYANNHAYCNFDVYRACIGYLDPFANLGDLAEASIPIGECRRCRKRFRFLDDFIDFILEHLAHKQAQQANTTRQGAKTTLQRNARSTRRRKVVAACGYEVIAALPLRMGLTEGSLSLANLLRHRDFGPRYAAAKKKNHEYNLALMPWRSGTTATAHLVYHMVATLHNLKNPKIWRKLCDFLIMDPSYDVVKDDTEWASRLQWNIHSGARYGGLPTTSRVEWNLYLLMSGICVLGG